MIVGLVSSALLLCLAPDLLLWMSPRLVGLVGLVASPALSRMSGDARIGRWLTVLNIPEEREPPAVVPAAAADEIELRAITGLAIADLTHNAILRADHLSTLSGSAEDVQDMADRLPAITARAKIEAAVNGPQAISWMNRDEVLALLSSTELLTLMATRALTEMRQPEIASAG